MKRYLLSILLAALALPAIAAQPQLIRSTPADGETNVPVDLQVIRFYFDQNMKMNQWTFWLSEKGNFPPMEGANDAHWRDPVTCELPVGMLEPNTTYAVQLNSTLRQGFRSAESNEALPVTEIVFRTGTETAAPVNHEQPEETPSDRSPPLPPGPAQLQDKPETKDIQAIVGPGTKEMIREDPEIKVLENSARDILTAWKAKDVDTVAGYATNKTMRKLFRIKSHDLNDPVWASMFSGNAWARVESWNGSLYATTKTSDSEATVDFSRDAGSGKTAALLMLKEDGDWRFSELVFSEKAEDVEEQPDSPTEVAKKLLNAYKLKDMDAMAELSTAFNRKLLGAIKQRGKGHPRYRSVFEGDRMAAVDAWDGGIRGEQVDSETEARVTFTDPDGEGNVIQVALVREDGLWRFEDLAFDETVTTLPIQDSTMESFTLQGTWACSDPGFRMEITFFASTRYTRKTTQAQQVETARGRYLLENSILELREDSGEVIRFPMRIKDRNTFEVQDEGEWVMVHRQ